MNTDDFEQRLERQQLRQIPAEWREDILSAARQASPSIHTSRITPPVPRWRAVLSTLNSQISTLLWPCPQAWAGLAAVWLGLLAFNFATHDAAVTAARHTTPASPQVLVAWREQEKLLVELIGPPEKLVAERPKVAVPRPRSEGRHGFVMA
jgi:hypothetical protein